jgi:hypothetical protein
MQQVSRKLLVAAVLAFGTLTAACTDTAPSPVTPVVTGVTSVTVSPQNASINVGTSITLAASVSADASTAKTVTWTTSNAAVATVDQTGKVTGVTAGTVTIIATSTANSSMSAAAAIVVSAVTNPIVVQPSIAINTVFQGGTLIPVNLSGAGGQFDVTVNTSGGGLIEVFLSSSCTTNTIGSTDVAVASQQATSAQAGTVTLSFNTAQLTASNAPRFPNGNYCIKARLTNGTATVVATNTTPVTLNNLNVFKGTLAFTSATGGPTSAVSTVNGLNYNQGSLTVTLNPVIFTSASPVALISGYLTRNGEVAAGPVGGNATFTNVAVTSGVATVFFTDSIGIAPAAAAGNRSITGYASIPAGDTLYVTSATDAAGNSITVPAGQFVVAGGVRIDNDAPTLVTYIVTAPNGYVGAAYKFSSGTTGTSTDAEGAVQGVGGITTTYYVGAAGVPAVTAACTTTGLTAAAVGTDLANTTTTTADQAMVVVSDALGNKSCVIVASSQPSATFGVDKISPIVSMTTSNNGAADQTGYIATKNFSFIYNDSISGFTPATPLTGTLVRNFFATPAKAADCLLGTYSASKLTCSAATITVINPGFGTPPLAGGSIEFSNGTLLDGYYTITASPVDRAGNVGASVTRTAALDQSVPTISALTQAAPVASLGTVTVSGAVTDGFDLASANGRLSYPTASNPFQSVGGTNFGPNFDATLVTSGTATVSLPNVYRGLQSTDWTAAGTIMFNTAVPVATMTVKDVGGNFANSVGLPIVTTTAAVNILVGNTFTVTPTSAAPATSQATTILTIRVGGLVADPAFQSQPFVQLDIYKLSGGELVLVGTNTLASVTDEGLVRTYVYTSTVALTAAATNTFFVVGRNAAGDAVISGGGASNTVIVNP